MSARRRMWRLANVRLESYRNSLDVNLGMTENKPKTPKNPRGAGRKPMAPEDRKIKTSVSLHPQTIDFLVKEGGGVLSQGIEVVTAEVKAAKRRK